MATATFTLTEEGYNTLMRSGLVDNIVYYNLIDKTHNYGVTAPEVIIPNITGQHATITTAECVFANYQGVAPTKVTTEEIRNTYSKVQLNFISENCSSGSFTKPILNLNINIFPWLQQLQSATYSYNMSESLALDLWSYIEAQIFELSVSTKDYVEKQRTTNLKINYTPVNKTDVENYTLVSPLFVTLGQGGVRGVYDGTSNKNASPFRFSFATNSANGTYVNGTSGVFSLQPTRWGYYINGTDFVTATFLETSDYNGFTSIYPAATVGSKIYTLQTNTNFPTKVGLIGYTKNMYNIDGSGQTLLDGLVEAAILFIKTYGKYDSLTNNYTIPINMQALVANQGINNITKKFGGQFNINIIYNDITPSTQIIELL